jgi:hypothetical protein
VPFVPLRKPGKLPGVLGRLDCTACPSVRRGLAETDTHDCPNCLFCCLLALLLCLIETGQTVSEAYITEYSTDTIEMHTGAVSPGQRVLLVRVAGLRDRHALFCMVPLGVWRAPGVRSINNQTLCRPPPAHRSTTSSPRAARSRLASTS